MADASPPQLPPRPPDYRGELRADATSRAVYAEAAGVARALPLAVAVPADADDVAALVRWARGHGVPLVPRGSGSSMAGGAVGPGVVVDLSATRGVGHPDRAGRRITAGPGATRAAVDAAAARVGLRFPVDPSSGRYATVGGMAATNAAGAHTLRHGAMRAWVEALDCVFDDGTRAEVRRGTPPPAAVPAVARFLRDAKPQLGDGAGVHAGVRKESSGYAIAEYARGGELVDLLVGSEGTLALFVGVELRLAPRPGATSSLLAAFSSLDGAVEGAARAREAAAAACELLDRTFLDVAAGDPHTPPLPTGTEAVLLIELEAEGAGAARDGARALAGVLHRAGASAVTVALDAVAEERLWALRHAASPILSRLDPALKSMQLIEDACVPPARLAEYVRGVRGALAARGIRGVIFGHAGDAHVHVNPLIDVRDPEWRSRAESLLEEVTSLTIALGGTLAGEHGDGRLRTPLIERAWPNAATRERFALVKRAFDPAVILNPGVKVPLPGQRPLDEVKYDPALPPLPAAARMVLDRLERERIYDRPRLELLAEAGA